jgi:competence protein ComEC
VERIEKVEEKERDSTLFPFFYIFFAFCDTIIEKRGKGEREESRMGMRQRTIFMCSLYMLGGLVCASQFVSSIRIGLTLFLLAICVGMVPLLKHQANRVIVIIGLLFLGVSFFSYIWIEKHNVSLLPEEATARFVGEIKSAVDIDGDRGMFTLRVRQWGNEALLEPELVRTTLYFRSMAEREKGRVLLRYGATLSGRMEVALPSPPSNPGAFDYPRYLHWQKIHRVGKIKSMQGLSYTSPSWSFTGMMIDWQAWLADRIDILYAPQTAGLLAGMLLGAVDKVDPDVYADFSTLGLTHIIAISGQHITLLMVGLVYVCRLCGILRQRAYIITAVCLPLYVMMSGSSPSAVRALLMGELVLLALWTNRVKDGWNLIGASFLVMALYDPYFIHDVGFQLSYLVTFGLLVFVPPLQRKIPISLAVMRGLVAVTFAATLVSFPITIFYFHRYSILSPFINFLFVPFMSILIAPMSAVSLLLGSIHPSLGFLVAKMVDGLLLPALRMIDFIESWQAFHLAFRSPSVVWMFFYLVYLLFFAKWLYDKIESNWKIKTFLVLSMIFLLVVLFPSWKKEGVTVTFLDVGQGDAIVIQTPRHAILIDGGGPTLQWNEEPWQKRREPFNPVKSVVLPFLYSQGISALDLLVLTHGDGDHIGGLSHLLQNMPVKQAMVNGQPAKTEIEKQVNRLLEEKRIPTVQAKKGQTWQEGNEIIWKVLHPASFASLSTRDNDHSIVLLLKAYGTHFLFTGDLEKEGEERLLREENIGPIDVLKVGHHGSKTSTSEAWVHHLTPAISVISVGKKNRYGHPHPEVIQRLVKQNSLLLRTDMCGAITVRVQKERITYETIHSSVSCQ